MEKLLEEYSEEFGKSVLDVYGHDYTKENLGVVEQTTNAILSLKGSQDLLEGFAKYFVAQFIQQGSLL